MTLSHEQTIAILKGMPDRINLAEIPAPPAPLNTGDPNDRNPNDPSEFAHFAWDAVSWAFADRTGLMQRAIPDTWKERQKVEEAVVAALDALLTERPRHRVLRDLIDEWIDKQSCVDWSLFEAGVRAGAALESFRKVVVAEPKTKPLPTSDSFKYTMPKGTADVVLMKGEDGKEITSPREMWERLIANVSVESPLIGAIAEMVILEGTPLDSALALWEADYCNLNRTEANILFRHWIDSLDVNLPDESLGALCDIDLVAQEMAAD